MMNVDDFSGSQDRGRIFHGDSGPRHVGSQSAFNLWQDAGIRSSVAQSTFVPTVEHLLNRVGPKYHGALD